LGPHRYTINKELIKAERVYISRRSLLKISTATVLVSATPLKVFSFSQKKNHTKSLWLFNTHTGEMMKETYWENGMYVPSSLEKLNFLLRDHRQDEVKEMDLSMINLMHQLQQLMDYKKPFDIISGYRSPRTNEKLRGMGRQVAKNSYHTRGMAIDISFSGLSLARAHKAALFLNKGGVGYYASSGFIHMDVRGKPVRWRGH
jgi:uncharacterized protein YcbK (DUF882 family)